MLVSFKDADVTHLRRRRWQQDYGVIVDVPKGALMTGGDVRGYEQLPETAGGVLASELPGSAGYRIGIGVATGALVFMVTRILDRLFFGGSR